MEGAGRRPLCLWLCTALSGSWGKFEEFELDFWGFGKPTNAQRTLIAGFLCSSTCFAFSFPGSHKVLSLFPLH